MINDLRTTNASHDHIVQFFRCDVELAAVVGLYLAVALRDGDSVLVVATPIHIADIEKEIVRSGLDVDRARSEGSWLALDANSTLKSFLIGDVPNDSKFAQTIGHTIDELAKSGRPITAFGEMVSLLWGAGNVSGTIALEGMWNRLVENIPFSLFCGYSGPQDNDELNEPIREICRMHSVVIGKSPLRTSSDRSWESELPATRHFAMSVEAPRSARHWTVGVLQSFGDLNVGDNAGLIVTELATNALLHARSAFTVEIAKVEGFVRVSVHDESRSLPEKRIPSPANSCGRGLLLVDSLTSCWGIELCERGKTIWAEIPLAQ